MAANWIGLTHCRSGNRISSVLLAQFWLPFGQSRADFALYRIQSPAKDRRHPRQVVSNQGEDGLRLHLRQSDKLCLAQAADGLGPAEDFFHPLAFFQAHRVAGMPRRPPIDGATSFLLRYMRRHVFGVVSPNPRNFPNVFQSIY